MMIKISYWQKPQKINRTPEFQEELRGFTQIEGFFPLQLTASHRPRRAAGRRTVNRGRYGRSAAGSAAPVPSRTAELGWDGGRSSAEREGGMGQKYFTI